MPKGDNLPTVWNRPPHTKAKHDILTRYLGAWFGIFGRSRYHQKVNILDGFAGPGRYDDDEPGSPVLTPPEVAASRGSFMAAADPVMPQLCPIGTTKTGPDCVSAGQGRYPSGRGDRI
ncbi:three-Cys-motif partner protein TcmP [Ornithinimicrobium sp. Y1694]|uniref:three-Cys-motif partner protein TcmP n=1 Tax=Ornithinimicrobium sp. Y1694 TaxID=3418590 RepID=UPI003CEB0A92